MRDRLAKIGSWGRRALMIGALLGAPALLAAPAAEARTVPAALTQEGPGALLVPVQWGRPPPPRPYYGGPRHWHRPPPPPHWRHGPRYGYRHGYPPPPPPRGYYRHYGYR